MLDDTGIRMDILNPYFIKENFEYFTNIDIDEILESFKKSTIEVNNNKFDANKYKNLNK